MSEKTWYPGKVIKELFNQHTKDFCVMLKAAIEDESKAQDEYRELHKAAFESMHELGILGYDAAKILGIIGDEKKHQEILSELYSKYCVKKEEV